MNKFILAGGIIVVLLVAAGVSVYLVRNIGNLVKELIESIGTQVTGTSVIVREVKLDLAEGKGAVNGFRIANPEGFSANNLLEVDRIAISIDTGSLTESVFVINRILIDGARVRAEQIGTRINVQILMDNIESDDEASGEDGSNDEDDDSDALLAVESLDFLSGAILLSSDIFGDEEFEMPDFKLSNLGTRDEGLTADQLGFEILWQVTGQIVAAVADELADLARDQAREALKSKLSESAAESIDKLKSLFNKEFKKEVNEEPDKDG